MLKCAMPMCNNEVEMGKNGKWKLHCSLKCRGQHNSITGTEKRKQTCIEKFGSTSNLTSQDTKDKIKNTLMEKYGVSHQMHVPEIKQKIKDTCVELYGVDNPSKSAIIKRKKIRTSLIHYGVEHPLRSVDVQSDRRNKSVEIYGVDHYSKTDLFKIGHMNQSHILPENFKKLKDPAWLQENSEKTCGHLAEILGVTKSTIAKSFVKFGIRHTSSYSYAELAVSEFIKSIYTGTVTLQSRKIISPKELDIYIPTKNLAIEYNGVYWHSEINGKNRNYHLDKTKQCADKNIRLIHIFDLEWETKQEIVKSRISSIMGVNLVTYARKCEVRQLSKEENTAFFNTTHLHGAVDAIVSYGLVYDGETVAAMSFGKARGNKAVEWELLQFSNKLYTTVAGGASKLFTYFIKSVKPSSIISYSDLRWDTARLYEQLGFIHHAESGPSYWYTKKYDMLESGIKYQKHKLKKILPIFDPGKSEWENMVSNGYDRIWDCGKSAYIWNSLK